MNASNISAKLRTNKAVSDDWRILQYFSDNLEDIFLYRNTSRSSGKFTNYNYALTSETQNDVNSFVSA